MEGDLGAGKTTLVRGLGRGLGISSGVKSPSFALHLTYPGRLPLHHLDLYRISDPADLPELGLDDFLGRQGVCVVEWAERLGSTAPPWAVRIRFTEPEEDRRRLRVSGERAIVERMAGALGAEVQDGDPS